MIGTAWAQAGGGGAPPAIVSFFPLLLVFVVFYFLLIRPQQQKAKEHKTMLDNLRKNDDVITAGGLYGKVVTLTDDVVTVEIASNVRIKVSRPKIETVLSAARKEDKDKPKDKDKDK